MTDGLLIVFFTDVQRQPFKQPTPLPVQVPATIELPHEKFPFAVDGISRVLAYVYEDPQKCAICHGKKCSACGYRPRRVGRYEQLFAPRRVRLELSAWEKEPGRVTG